MMEVPIITETIPLNCRSNQWTGFSVMKDLNFSKTKSAKTRLRYVPFIIDFNIFNISDKSIVDRQ